MKKILIISNVVLLSIVVFQACKSLKEGNTNIARMGTTCMPCRDYSSVPLTLMDANLAKAIAERYAGDAGKNFIVSGGTASAVEDARSVWFSLETLKNFIWKIEDPLCKQGCTGMGLGLRIYYAKYPEDMASHPSLAGLSNDFRNRHTVFIVPTYNDGSRNVDFDPANLGPVTCRPKTFKQWFNDSIPPSLPPLVLSVQNHGDLAPPPPGIATFGN